MASAKCPGSPALDSMPSETELAQQVLTPNHTAFWLHAFLPLTTAIIVLRTVALPISILVDNCDHFCIGWARSKHSLHRNRTVSIYSIFPARCAEVQQQKMVWITLLVALRLEISIAWLPKMNKFPGLSSGLVLSKFITHLSSLLLLSNLCIHHILSAWS